MLAGRFAEGTRLANAGYVEIPLLDDSYSGMFGLCKILHYNTMAMMKTSSMGDMLDCAILADKYDCVEAIFNSAYRWISELIQGFDSRSAEEHSKALLAAYLLRQNELFGKLASRMVMASEGQVDRVQVEAVSNANLIFGTISFANHH